MKKSIFCISCLFVFCTCYPEYMAEYIDYSSYENYPNCFTPFREQDRDLDDYSSGQSNSPALYAPSYTSPLSTNDVYRGVLSQALTNRIHEVAGTYRSVNLKGDSITLSGKFFYPASGVIKNIVVVSHFTITSNAEAPSESFSFEGMYAGKGYGIVIADYIGYGVTRDSIHPYLQADLTARNVIDMALSIRPFIAKRKLKVEDDSIILVGYSQGGATTLHVQRLLENYREYKGEFAILKNYAGAGPYDIAATYDKCIEIDEIAIPCAVPMIVQGMSVGMDEPLNMEDFFVEPLLSNYDEWINSKRYTTNEIAAKIGTTKVSAMLTEQACDKTNPETQRLYAEFMKNSIPADFIPQAPLFMYHSKIDKCVPFVNSERMREQFGDRPHITYDFGNYGEHSQAGASFILKVLRELD